MPTSTQPRPDCDQLVRSELASSLRHVAHAGHAVLSETRVDIEALCRRLEGHRVHPTVFARYYELVLALKAGRCSDAAALYRELADQSHDIAAFRIVPLADPSIDREAARYVRWLSPRGGVTPPIDAANLQHWSAFQSNIRAGLDLIERANPELGAELRCLITEVVGVSRNRGSPEAFEGASTFMLWGSIFLNVDVHTTRIHAIAGLVHEAAHLLLFALSCREPLVNNALNERYASPVRRDPRPVVGIYHAAFVCARMCNTYDTLLRADLDISAEERAALNHRRRRRGGCLVEGLDTLRRDGDLTDLGQRLLDEEVGALEAA